MLFTHSFYTQFTYNVVYTQFTPIMLFIYTQFTPHNVVYTQFTPHNVVYIHTVYTT